MTDALGNSSTIFTDDLGRARNVTDPLGNVTTFSYDAVGRFAQATDDSGSTVFNYDANGNLLTALDPRALQAQTFTYDSRNRVHTYSSPSGGTETYEYDAMGNLRSILDRRGQTTVLGYDGLNRLNHVTYPDASTLDVTWDAGNRVTDFVDSVNGTVHRVYDDLDRLRQENSPQGQVNYDYDNAGRRQQVTIAGQAQPLIYQFDVANRLTQITQGSTVVGFGYDAADRRTSVTLPNGIVGTFGYDDADRLTSISYDKGSTHIADVGYTYDANGRRISATGSLVRPMLDPVFDTASFDAGNRLTSLGGASLAYDGNGNLTSNAATPLTGLSWNARDQLISTGRGSVFSYDALGRLASRTVGSATTNYLWDGYNALQVNGNVQLRGLGLDELEAQFTSSGLITHLTDGLGSSVMLADATGSVSTVRSYGAYASTASVGTSGPATVESQYQFAGADYNPLDRLYYLRSRYLAPELARFISEDPVGLDGGLNFYAYADGDPIVLTDPLGLWAFGDPLPQGVVDFSAGWGDELSFGLTNQVRNLAGWNDVVDKCSGAYAGGEVAGFLNGLALGGANGAKSAVKAELGPQFSHSLFPDKFLKTFENGFGRWLNRTGNRLNGDYVGSVRHAMMDPAAHRFAPRSWKADHPYWPAWRRLMNRMPYTPGAAAYGAGSALLNSGGCDCQ
jgi:RHS repeat-associated protein